VNWQRAVVQRLDRYAALLTIIVCYLDARWSCGVIDRRWLEREESLRALTAMWDEPSD
jgi:hypothetical protein